MSLSVGVAVICVNVCVWVLMSLCVDVNLIVCWCVNVIGDVAVSVCRCECCVWV